MKKNVAPKKPGQALKAAEPYFWLAPSTILMVVMILVPIVSLCTAKPDAALVEDAFSCYDASVVVKAKSNLGD